MIILLLLLLLLLLTEHLPIEASNPCGLLQQLIIITTIIVMISGIVITIIIIIIIIVIDIITPSLSLLQSISVPCSLSFSYLSGPETGK